MLYIYRLDPTISSSRSGEKWLRKLRRFSIIGSDDCRVMDARRESLYSQARRRRGAKNEGLLERIAVVIRPVTRCRVLFTIVRHWDDPTSAGTLLSVSFASRGETSASSPALRCPILPFSLLSHCLFCIQRFDHATLTRLTT